MSLLIEKVIANLAKKSMVPEYPKGFNFPLPAINKVELYLSFYGNDHCEHCITNSGPDRKETLSIGDAERVIENIARYSVITRLRNVLGGGEYESEKPYRCEELSQLEAPPEKFDEKLIQEYSNCLMGRGYTSRWVNEEIKLNLNFGRPSIRISGGEFYMWPRFVDGRDTTEDERLDYQKQLLNHIRTMLPEYDIYILTNGRFAESNEKALRVVEHWAGQKTPAGGATRICISVDVFHNPPKNSTLRQMLERMWLASREHGLGVPFLYGVTNHRIALVGRALESFGCSEESKPVFKHKADSFFNLPGDVILDPVYLTTMDGCRELKGFVCETGHGTMFVNNIIVMPSGHMAYCCVCVGDFGDFINEPEECLKNCMRDPVAIMLRQKITASNLLNTAVQMDPTIKVFGDGEYAAVTGSTCYQLLSGVRV